MSKFHAKNIHIRTEHLRVLKLFAFGIAELCKILYHYTVFAEVQIQKKMNVTLFKKSAE